LAAEILGLDVLVEGFKKFMGQMDQMDGAIGDTGKKWGGLSGIAKKAGGVLGKVAKVGLIGVATGATAAAGAVAGVTVALGKMAMEAAPVQGLQNAFQGLTKDFVGGSDAMLKALQEASGGMITNRDLMESFNKASSLVSKDFAQQLPDAMGYLSKVAASTGQDMGFMMDSLVTGVGRLSPMILDNLAIQVNATEANEAYAEAMGISVKEMTKEQQQAAMMNQVLEKLAANTADMPDVTGSAAQGMASLGVTFQNFKDEVGLAFLPVLQEVMGFLSKLAADVLPQLMPYIQMLAEYFASLVRYILFTVESGDSLNDWLVHLPEGIQPIVQWIGEFIVGLKEAWAWLQSEGPSILENFQAIWAKVWSFIQELAAEFVAWFQENLPLIQDTGAALVLFWEEHIVPALDNIWTIIKTIVQTAMRVIMGIIKTVMQMITGDWEGAWTTIKDIALQIWEAIKTIVTEFIEGVANAVGTTTAEIIETWRKNWEMAKLIVKTAIENIIKIVTDKVKEMYQVGYDLFMGMYKGIREAVKNIIKAVGKWIQDIIEEAKKRAGISSPSKVFEQIGRDMMGGLALGLNELAPAVQAQINAAVSPLALGGGGRTTNVTSTTNNYYSLTTQSVTRPGGLKLEFDNMAMASR